MRRKPRRENAASTTDGVRHPVPAGLSSRSAKAQLASHGDLRSGKSARIHYGSTVVAEAAEQDPAAIKHQSVRLATDAISPA